MTPRLTRDNLLNVESRLRQFREEYDIHYAPVDCFLLVRQIRLAGKIDLEWSEAQLVSDAFDAEASWYPEFRCYRIVTRRYRPEWKQYSPARRINFTLAHELGHIFLGHLAVPDILKSAATMALEDMEADAFAARLLMPEEVFGLFCSVKEAADALWVSESAVRVRQMETGILLKRRKCPGCGFSQIPTAARFCRKCGLLLADGPNPADPPYIAYLPPKEKECFFCGEPFLGRETECPYCMEPTRNMCLPEYDQPRHYAATGTRFCQICGARTAFSFFKDFRDE